MRWFRIALTQTDVAQKISTLASLTTKQKNIAQFIIYPEDGNNVDATNGAARIGDSTVSRVVAGPAKGVPLLPGILETRVGQNVGGSIAPYSFDHLYISGASGDAFNIGYVLP